MAKASQTTKKTTTTTTTRRTTYGGANSTRKGKGQRRCPTCGKYY